MSTKPETILTPKPTRGLLRIITFASPISVPVDILDERRVYGRTDWLVRPIGGTGETWVSRDSVLSASE